MFRRHSVFAFRAKAATASTHRPFSSLGTPKSGVGRSCSASRPGGSSSSLFPPSSAAAAYAPQCSIQRRAKSSDDAKADHYEVLGLGKNATENEIKKAYRTKVMKAHPDRGGSHEEFTKISAAYETLSNPDKRRMYDQYGHAAEQMGGPGGPGGPGGRSAEEIFEQFFRGMGGMGGGGFPGGFPGGGGMGGRQRQRVADIDVQVSLSLEEIATGAAKSVRVKRPAICRDCNGEGSKVKGGKKRCMQCNGSGQQVRQHQMGPNMVQQVVAECGRCGGKGVAVDPQDECKKCRGDGYQAKSEEVSINVPPGVHHGSVLVMEGMAGEVPDAESGNINIHVEQLPHRTFERKGSDLIMTAKVTLSEALLGMELRVQLLDGRVVLVKSEEGKILKHGGVLTLLNEGLPKLRQGGRGHIYIVTNVTMPAKLTDAQKEKIKDVFGEPKKDAAMEGKPVVVAKPASGTFEEIARAKQAEWAQEEQGGASRGGGGRRRGGGGGGHPGMGGGDGQQVQCAQQ